MSTTSTNQEVANKVVPAVLDKNLISTKVKSEISTEIKLSAIFDDSNDAKNRTPMNLLDEICRKSHRALPKYELVNVDYLLHPPLFVFKCKLETDYEALGKGSSKKKAKQLCALNVLYLIRDKFMLIDENLANRLDTLM